MCKKNVVFFTTNSQLVYCFESLSHKLMKESRVFHYTVFAIHIIGGFLGHIHFLFW